MIVTKHAPYHWRERLMQMLLIPLSPGNMEFLAAMSYAEGTLAYGATGGPQNNPLNTTYPMPWSDDWNSVGVKNYDSPVEGISATASTFARDAGYHDWWKDMQKGTLSAEQITLRNRDAIQHWGTDPDVILRVLRVGP
jgi:hypothetical protein